MFATAGLRASHTLISDPNAPTVTGAELNARADLLQRGELNKDRPAGTFLTDGLDPVSALGKADREENSIVAWFPIYNDPHMQIDERVVGDVIILDLKGTIVLNEGDVVLRDKINSLIQQGKTKVVLNLAGVPYIDSAGLGEVVRTYSTVRRHNGNLKMVHLTKRITDLLTITKLLMVFETFDSEKEALESFT